MDDRVDWVAGLAQVGGREAIGSRDTPANWRVATAEAHLPEDGSAARFGSPEQAEFRTGSAGPPTRSSRPFRRKQGSWS